MSRLTLLTQEAWSLLQSCNLSQSDQAHAWSSLLALASRELQSKSGDISSRFTRAAPALLGAIPSQGLALPEEFRADICQAYAKGARFRFVRGKRAATVLRKLANLAAVRGSAQVLPELVVVLEAGHVAESNNATLCAAFPRLRPLICVMTVRYFF